MTFQDVPPDQWTIHDGGTEGFVDKLFNDVSMLVALGDDFPVGDLEPPTSVASPRERRHATNTAPFDFRQVDDDVLLAEIRRRMRASRGDASVFDLPPQPNLLRPEPDYDEIEREGNLAAREGRAPKADDATGEESQDPADG